jgi:hypothetical protein
MAWAGWRADYAEWEAALLARGLPAHIVGVELLPPWNGSRLLALVVDVDEAVLPRSHQQRGFKLHLTLLFEEELNVDLAAAALRVHQRWAGRQVVLNIAWVGSGGAAFIAATDPIAMDPDVAALHSAGYYASRGLHVSL